MKHKITIAVTLLAFFFGISNVTAATVDVGINVTNQTKWTFTDGTNTLSPLFNGTDAFYAGSNYGLPFSGWWQADFDFSVNNLDAAGAPSLQINGFSADDRAALYLNGTLLELVGIGSGSGQFSWTNGGPLVAVDGFLDNSASAASFDVSGILQNGTNSLKIIINDTNTGISGSTLSSAYITSLRLDAAVTYSQLPTSIPTLSEWGMIILSTLLAMGTVLTLRRQRL
jgi:hypothetical protein